MEQVKNYDEYNYLDKYDFGLRQVASGDYDNELYPNKLDALKKFISLNYGYYNGDTTEVTLNTIFLLLKEVAMKVSRFENNAFAVFFYWYGETMRHEETEKILDFKKTKKEKSHIEIMIQSLISFLSFGFPVRDKEGNLKYGLTKEILEQDPWNIKEGK